MKGVSRYARTCDEGDDVRVLLIDTCGDEGSVALSDGAAIVAVERLPARGSSSALLPAIGQLLEVKGWVLAELDGIGVVTGPGSFTGVRVGLAAAKGLCEAAGIPLIGVSRLEALAGAAKMDAGVAVLNAGRGEFYVRVVGAEAREVLCGMEDLRGLAEGGKVVIAEEKLVEMLAELRPSLVTVSVEDALPLVLRDLQSGAVDAAMVDANYVRSEQQIYAKPKVVAESAG